MNNYLRYLILVLVLVPAFSLKANVDDVTFGYRVDDLSSFVITFASYHKTGTGPVTPFTIDDTLNYRFDWQFGDGQAGNLPVLIHSYESAGIYDVSVSVTEINDPFRVFSESFQVTVNDSFEVPNVFTPDGDGHNDSFIVRSNGVSPLTITIIDRSGSVVYRQSSPVINWDGRTASGIRVNPGVYYYVITSAEPFYNKTGFVHIFYNN